MIPTLDVYDNSFPEATPVGRARFSLRRGEVSTTFAYHEEYLANQAGAYAIDPALPLGAGAVHCPGLPGSFRDSLPDRWGRHLILRDHRDACIDQGTAPRQLDDVDFLAGVFDETREGSLRFRLPSGEFLASSSPIPPIVELPSLLHASRCAAEDEAGRSQVKELLEAGSGSLGGARPKASIRDGERLLLAKFSHPKDEWDVMAWEKTMLDMAEAAGIAVPRARLVPIGSERVLLLERFDREHSLVAGQRIGYISAMTALRADDGELRDYAELAEELPLLTNCVKPQLTALFRRVTFSIAVHNTDDHLRNWGFLRQKGTWLHAPLFDVNPNPYDGAARSTSLMGETGPQETIGLKELAAYAQLDQSSAAEEVRCILSAVSRWVDFARANGCREREIALFRPVFADRQKALKQAFDL